MNRTRLIAEVGPLELRLLRILWKRHPGSARDVLDEYNRKADKPIKYTTVLTLLTRLTEKGILAVDRSRQPFHFSPAVTREQLLRQRIREFVEIFFDGQPLDLALRLVEDGPLSDEELKKLEACLERQRSGGSDEINQDDSK
jgi:predicted transcriptional regulator